MSEKRTKADKTQRQADQLEKKARHPRAKKKRNAPRGPEPRRSPRSFMEPIPIPVELRCGKCGREALVAETNLTDDSIVTCTACGMEIGNWGDVRKQALESSAETHQEGEPQKLVERIEKKASAKRKNRSAKTPSQASALKG
jgi:DNA-directed RNA polymerase subunit RPC12/RpoP